MRHKCIPLKKQLICLSTMQIVANICVSHRSEKLLNLFAMNQQIIYLCLKFFFIKLQNYKKKKHQDFLHASSTIWQQ